MAQLHQKYDFYPSENKVEIHGAWPLARIMVIANATTNELIYNFAASNIGVVSHEIDHEREVTVMVLNKDCSSMSSDDTLQVMLALDFQYMKPEEALMDPVHKLRVSTPENLIDTDFEYGLQPTKWETLETLNNVPSFFISEGDTPLTIISTIKSLTDSNIVTVACTQPHGLSVGTPVDVQGLTSRTAEGKFLISSVTDTEFVYKASGVQRETGEIGSIYTTVTPGTFFTGSEIGFDPTTGLSTDAADQSLITLTTNTPHGFQEKNQFYLVNTLGTKELTVDVPDTQATAADGRKIVDVDNVISEISLADSSLTETKAMRGRHYVKFNASAVNTDENTITWNEHQLRENDCVIYAPPSGNQEIGGLGRYKVYHVNVVDANRIKLRNGYNGSILNFSSAGEYTKGRGALHMVYEIYRSYIYYNRTYSDLWTRYHQTTQGSGWDLYATYNGARGLGAGTSIKYLLIEQVNNGNQRSHIATNFPETTPNTSYGPPAWTEYNFDGYGTYREWTNGENFGSDGNSPGLFNPIEDFEKWEGLRWNQNLSYAGYFRFYKYRYSGNYNDYPANNGWGWYVIPLVEDEESDSVFVENHGLSSGDNVVLDYITDNGYGETEYATPGADTFTVPAGVTSISVLAVGGGGGGNQYNNYSTGGGGGGLAYKNDITVTPGEQIPIYVGAGGGRGGYTTSYTNNSFGHHSVFNTSDEPIVDLANNYNNWNVSSNGYGGAMQSNANNNMIGRGISSVELSRTDSTNRPADDGSSLAFKWKDAYRGQPYQYTDWANALRLYNVARPGTSGDFTVECWVWRKSAYNSQAHIMGWSHSEGAMWIQSNGDVHWYDTGYRASTGAYITTTGWHHVAVTRQGNTLRIFIDGVQRGSGTHSANYGNYQYFQIGKDITAGTSYNANEFYIYRPHYARSCKYTTTFTPEDNYGTTTNTEFLLTIPPKGKNVVAFGGQAGYRMQTSSAYHGAVGGGGFGLGGGKGGDSLYAGSYASGGGGAAGYTGKGGDSGASTYQAGISGDGGGGGGGGNGGSGDAAGNGGGVGIYGQGTNGRGGSSSSSNGYNGEGGSGGEDGGRGYNVQQGSSNYINKGGDFGGGGGGADNSSSENGSGGAGAIRIVWPGDVRQFPSTNVGRASSSLQKSTTSSTWNDLNISSSLGAGTSATVDVLSANRFRLNGVRLYEGTDSDIQFTLNKTNPLANSFHVPGHGLTTGSDVRFTLGNGGVLPAVDGGTINPSPSTNQNTDSTVKFFSILDNYVSTYLSSLSTVDLVTATNPNSTRVFNTGTTNNVSPIDYYDLQYTTNFVWYSNYGSYNIPNNNFYVGDLSSTTPLNILRGSPLEDRNNVMVATDWTANSSLPYYMWIRSSGYQSGENWYAYFRDGFNFDSSANYILSNINGDDNNTFTATSGNTYRWAAAWFRHNEQNNSHCIYINLRFYKYQGVDAWNSPTTSVRFQGSQSQTSQWYSFATADRRQDDIELGLVFFPATSEADLNSNAEMISFINGMLEDFDVNTAKPEFTDDTVYSVNVLSNDRIALATNGVTLDLTDEGTAPFIFKTENSIGVIDGVYSAASVTSNRINIQTDTKVEGARVIVDTTTITDDTLQVAEGVSHTFVPGTEVTYDSNGQDILGGLEDGQTYYVQVVDDQYFKLSATAEDAALGINPIAISANTGGNQSFTTDNIAGIIEATGTVDVEAGTNKISGTETIFKRYFKVGDLVYIKNNTTTPGSLDSYTITSIADDAIMTVDRPVNFTATDTKYFVSTKVYVRPDGFAIHRPFDGGVEIAAGTSPLSQIRRQTRKYFRYQSGKGIQTSLAINFNPPITVESLSSTVDNDIKVVLEDAILEATLASRFDIASGSNYNAVTTGLEQSYETSIKANFASSIEKVEERLITIGAVSSSSTALDNANTHFTIINDILANGEDTANTEVAFPNPSSSSGATALTAEIAAKDKLIANKVFIIEELKAWADENFVAAGYNVTNFNYRIGYAINALAYDVLYGANSSGAGNSASYDFALFMKSITSDDFRNVHIGVFERLHEIVGDIVTGVDVTPTSGNTETQVTSGNNARSTEANFIKERALYFRDVMRFDSPHLEGTGTAPTLTVSNDGASNYIITGDGDPDLTLVRGVTYNFDVQAPGHPFWIKTAAGTGTGNAYNTGVTNNGAEEGTVSITVDASAPNTLYYQCENHAEMVGTITVIDAPSRTEATMSWSTTALKAARDAIYNARTNIVNYSIVDTFIATVKTKYPHRLTDGLSIKIKDASDSTYNGEYGIESIPDEFTFTYVLPSRPSTSVPSGIIKYTLGPYTGAALRSGMFDDQNGFFFEFDGTNVNCVRRTSTAQLSGSVSVLKNSGKVTGNGFTQFSGQLNPGDKIVLRGQTYKVTSIESNNVLYIQPAYRGVSANGIIVTKTEDIRVPQDEWSLDKCDGTGPSGFLLDITKIQMTYSDYSWYGAGKIRFGFKNQDGHVIYVHEFVHNNRLDESYMRSGNVPGRYEIENGVAPQYAPTLFHWGTSVIMDGTFDDDKAYLFTAASESLTFTNGDSATVNTAGGSSLVRYYQRDARAYDYYVRIPFTTTDADKFYNGLPLYTANEVLNGQTVSFTQYRDGVFYAFIFIQRSYYQPTVYPIVSSGTAVSLAVPATGGQDTDVNLGTDTIPLVSFRLAPSVDNNLSGNLGERDIINRMQLKLKETGVILSHDCDVKLILNGDLSTVAWEGVPTPSLSQLIKHQSGDTITGGTELFTFRAAGGAVDNTGKRATNDTSLSLVEIIDMGNSILGGDGTFPNGPDVLTVAVQVRDTNDIDAGNPFIASARINWAESQA